jgi:hypothetical protein
MKKKELVVVFLLIAFGFVYRSIEKGKTRFLRDFSYYSEERRLTGSQFMEFSEKEKVFQGIKEITIENPAGEINIGGSQDGQVHLSSFFRIYYSDKDDAGRIYKNIRLQTEIRGEELNVSGRYATAFPYRRLRIHMQLSVPEGIALTVSNREGNVVIRNTGKNIQLNQENGNLVLENIPSGVYVELKNGNANVKNIAEHVDIFSSRANITLENVFSLRLQGRHGDCLLNKIKNNALIEHAYGKLVLDDVDKVEIRARHTNVIARNIRSGIKLFNNYENTFVENVAGDIHIESRSSRIDLQHVSGQNVVIENSFADINILDYSGENLDILLENGKLDLQVKNAANRINIESKNAELVLAFGLLADPTFNIKTRHGQIYDHLSVDLEKYEENADRFANRVGEKPEILVNNTYGDIHLKNTD